MKLLEEEPPASGAISMPDVRDVGLEEMAAQLRGAGEIVINCPSGQPSARCDRQIVDEDGSWIVRPL